MSYIPDGFSVVTLGPEPTEVEQEDWDKTVSTNRDDSEFIKNRIPRWADYPTENASGHDWFTRVNDQGVIVQINTIAATLFGAGRNRNQMGIGNEFYTSMMNSYRKHLAAKTHQELNLHILEGIKNGWSIQSGLATQELYEVGQQTGTLAYGGDLERLWYVHIVNLERRIKNYLRPLEVARIAEPRIHVEYLTPIVNAADRPNGQLTGFDPNLVIKKELGPVCSDCNMELSKVGTCYC